MRKKGLICILLSFSMLLAACGSNPSTLEGMIEASPDAKAALEEQCADGQSVEADGNSLVYTYKFEETFKKKDIKRIHKDIEKEMQESRLQFQKTKAALKESSGIEEIAVKIVYLNGNGDEIYSEEI